MKYQTSERWLSAQSERLKPFMSAPPSGILTFWPSVRLWTPAVTTRMPGLEPFGDGEAGAALRGDLDVARR